MKKLLAVVSVAFVLGGCATNGDIESANIQIKSLEEHITSLEARTTQIEDKTLRLGEARKIDQTQFCFANNMAFSEGSIYGYRLCKRQSGFMVVQNGQPVVQPLIWVDWKQSSK